MNLRKLDAGILNSNRALRDAKQNGLKITFALDLRCASEF